MEHKILARHPIGNPRRLWKQDNFLLCVSNPAPLKADDELSVKKASRAVKTCADAGFGVMECLWASRKVGMEIVRSAERYGVGVIYQDLSRFGGMGRVNVFCETDDLKGAIEYTKAWKSVMGYCLWDEPVYDETMQAVHEKILECERECPSALPFTVANPSDYRMFRWEDDNYTSYIQRFGDIIDPAQFSFDHYPVGKTCYVEENQLDDTLMWCDMETVRRAAQERSIPFWFYYQGHKYAFHKRHYRFTFPMAKAMANAGILHGAKALSAYIESDGPVSPEDGGKGVFFEEYKKMNSELINIGNVLMALECQRVIHDDSLLKDSPYMAHLRTPVSESELLNCELPRRISVSEHKDAYGNKYLMVLNRDFDLDASIYLTLKNRSNVYKVNKETGEEEMICQNTASLYIRLDPAELNLYRIQNAEEKTFTVEYRLEK